MSGHFTQKILTNEKGEILCNHRKYTVKHFYFTTCIKDMAF